MIKHLASASYHFLLELIVGLICFFFFYIGNKELPPILMIVVLSLGGFIVFLVLLRTFSNLGKGLYLVIVFPILLVLGIRVGFPLYGVIVLGLYIFWRGISLFRNVTEHSETLFLFLSFSVGILAIVYSALRHYPYQNFIVLLLFSQIVLVLVGMFLRKWSTVTEDRTRFVVYFLKILAGALAVGMLLIPLFSLIEFLLGLFSGEPKIPNNLSSGLLKEVGKHQVQPLFKTPNLLVLFLFLLFFLTLAAVVFIIYLKQRKKVTLQIGENRPSSLVEITKGILRPERKNGKSHIKPPDDLIRKEIFYLEKFAKKLKLGRHPFETLDEWWQRMGLNEMDQAISIYEKARYGSVHSSIEEQMLIKSEVQQVKKWLKEKAKSEKKKMP